MKVQEIDNTRILRSEPERLQESEGAAVSFEAALGAASSPDSPAPLPGGSPENRISPANLLHTETPSRTSTTSKKDALAAYAQQSSATSPVSAKSPTKNPDRMSDWEKYKDDQLLRNPGGSRYDLDQRKVADESPGRRNFLARVSRNLSDVAGNVKNFFGNFFLGTRILYRDENNQIQEGHQKGLIARGVDFLKNMGSALTLGLWHPDDEKAPDGFAERLGFFCSKLKKAVLGDVIQGIPQSVNHMGKNLVLAGWNLIEVLPNATIGNTEGGEKLSATIFDNGQVIVEYLTDIVPSGDAWLRVHAAKLTKFQPPILYNIKMPEHTKGDARWEYVRNTPLRKTIETIGALLADAASVVLGVQGGVSGNHEHERQQVEELLK